MGPALVFRIMHLRVSLPCEETRPSILCWIWSTCLSSRKFKKVQEQLMLFSRVIGWGRRSHICGANDLFLCKLAWVKLFNGTNDWWVITCIFNLKYYHIKLILMLILCNYDACYHTFINFFHCCDILLKSTFLHYLGLIMCFIDVWPFSRSNN